VTRAASVTAATVTLLGAVILCVPVMGHDWYPRECCNESDCVPVDSAAWFVPAEGAKPQLVVTSKRGSAVIPEDFPVRHSKDSRMHVCMRLNEFGTWDVMCLFVPSHV
jgi:hypothetical protein